MNADSLDTCDMTDIYCILSLFVEVREYLEGLRQSSETMNDETDDDIDSLSIISNDGINPNTTNKDNGTGTEPPPNATIIVGDGRDFERWLFSDWLNKPTSAQKGGRQKEPALPILKDAKWNSGDNPVLVTAAIMLLGVILASITERIAT